MRGFDSFLQFIVPMSILAIWALTSLLNREAQPLPPRPNNRPPNPPGPRPGGMVLPPRPQERRPEPPAREPSARWPSSGAAERPGTRRPPVVRPEDEIVILESETRRPSPPRPGGGNGPRRNPRGRSAPSASPPPKRADSASPRALSESMARESPSQIGRFLELNPLARIHSPLSTQESHDVARVAAPDSLRTTPTPPKAPEGDLVALLRSPEKLREAVILSEILRPPLALRHPGDFQKG